VDAVGHALSIARGCDSVAGSLRSPRPGPQPRPPPERGAPAPRRAVLAGSLRSARPGPCASVAGAAQPEVGPGARAELTHPAAPPRATRLDREGLLAETRDPRAEVRVGRAVRSFDHEPDHQPQPERDEQTDDHSPPHRADAKRSGGTRLGALRAALAERTT